MSILLTILLILIFFGCVAMFLSQGLWSTAIALINTITAGLLAMNFFEPAAGFLEGILGDSFTYLAGFIALWGVFIISLSVLRVMTDYVSRIKVKFIKVVDIAGCIFLASWIGWVMICFTMTTLHVAPLGRESFAGAFKPEDKMFLGLAPDHKWLGFTQSMSKTSFSRGDPDETQEKYVFDKDGEFIPKYAARRTKFESLKGMMAP